MKAKELIAGQTTVTVELETPLGEVVTLLAGHHVSGLPVVDKWGALAGVVTSSDLMRVASQGGQDPPEMPIDAAWSPAQHVLRHVQDWVQLTAADVMVSDLCTLDVEASVQEVARGMINRSVHRAILLDADRRIAGVVSALDLALFVAEMNGT